jgi:hypothetical protein
MSNADLQLTHGLLQARVAGLGPNDPERPAAEGNAAIVSAEATRRNLTLTRPSDAGANPVTGEVASVPVVFVAEEITPFPTSIMPPDPQPGPPGPWPEAPGPAPLPVPWADSAAPTGGSTLATLGMSSHMFAMGEHSWISAEQSFSTMFGRNYWSSMVPRTGTMLADRALNTLPRDLYPILQTTLEGGAVDASRLASMTSMAADHGIAMSDLMRTPELIQRFNSGAATLEEVAILRRIANLHIGATTRDSPLVSYMVPEAPVPGVGARQFRVRVEVPRNQVLDVSAPNSRAALHGMENVEEAEFILSMNHQGRIVNVQTIPPGGVSPGTSFSTRAASFAARNAGAIRWAGRIALVAGLALSGYRIATAAPEERGRVIGQEAGGLALGIVGTAAGAATCIALGVATAGFGLLLCGLAGGAAMGALGSAAGGGIGEFVQGSIKTVKQAAEEIGRSPGSLLAPGLVTPLVFRGGYGGLLRYGGQR